MNFFEQELHKIVAPKYPDATYVGRACYVRLDELNRAKIQFVTGIVANQYHALPKVSPVHPVLSVSSSFLISSSVSTS